MKFQWFDNRCIDSTYFCDTPCKIGQVVRHKSSNLDCTSICGAVNGCNETADIIGLSMHNVVEIDQIRFHLNFSKDEAMIGSKIHILTKGSLKVHFNKRLKLPRLQPIYVDYKTGELTWRYGRLCGKVITQQNPLGWCLVEVEF